MAALSVTVAWDEQLRRAGAVGQPRWRWAQDIESTLGMRVNEAGGLATILVYWAGCDVPQETCYIKNKILWENADEDWIVYMPKPSELSIVSYQ